MVAAQQAVGDVKYQLYYFTIPSTLRGKDPLEALEFAKGQLDQARADYEPYKNHPEEEVPRLNRNPNPRDEYQQRLKDNLEGAQRDYNAALRWFELEAALVDAQVRLADAKLEYERLQNGPDPDEIALAEARVANTQAQLDLVSNKCQTAEQLNLAHARVDTAQAQLQEARMQLDQLTLHAPLDGVLSAIHIDVGEWAMPGKVVVEMLDLSSWLVETKNVGELQIGQVKIGQSAQVRFNAFQGKTVSGKIKAISPQSVVQQGDITYTLVIALEPTDLNLRPGMTARVEILTE
jgi:multidrug resistance efflux pump